MQIEKKYEQWKSITESDFVTLFMIRKKHTIDYSLFFICATTDNQVMFF